MVAGDRLPVHFEKGLVNYSKDNVVGRYEVPLIWIVEIRQDPNNNHYMGWISGYGVINIPKTGDLRTTKDFIGNIIAGLAEDMVKKAQREYEKVSKPYGNLLSINEASMREGKSLLNQCQLE